MCRGPGMGFPNPCSNHCSCQGVPTILGQCSVSCREGRPTDRCKDAVHADGKLAFQAPDGAIKACPTT